MCVEWAELYTVPDQLRLQLKTEHLLHLLEEGQADEAFQVLHARTAARSERNGFALTTVLFCSCLKAFRILSPV